MASLNQNAKLNDFFIESQIQYMQGDYRKYIDSVKGKITSGMSKNDINKLINNTPLTLNVDRTVIVALIQGAILNVLNSKKTVTNDLMPIVALLTLFGTKNEFKLVKKVNKISKSILTGNTSSLTRFELSGYKEVSKFINANTTEIKAIKRSFQLELVKVNKLVKSNLSKNLMDRLIIAKDLKLTTKEISKQFKKTNDYWRVKRVLDTEIHTLNEQVKVSQGKKLGFTHKTWRTQRDNKVRDTHYHNKVANKKVPLDSPFRAVGLEANFPGDNSLPIGERINCRCYVILS